MAYGTKKPGKIKKKRKAAPTKRKKIKRKY